MIKNLNKIVVAAILYAFFHLVCPGALHGINSEKKIERINRYSQKFIDYFERNETDSIAFVLNMWEIETGMNEALFRAYSLFLIKNEKFPGHLLQHGLLDKAISWEIRYGLLFEKEREDYFDTHTSFFSYINIGSSFDRFTINMARRMVNNVKHGSLDFYFLKLYAGDVEYFFHAFPEGKYSGTILGHEYEARYNELIELPETHLAVTFGSMIPHGNLSVIGLRPTVGVKIGRWFSPVMLDVAFDVRFSDTENYIDIPLTDTIMLEVSNYLGARAAIEGAVNLVKFHPNSIDIFIGTGFEWFEMVKSWQDRRGKSFGSPVVSAGLTYRYFFPNRFNIALSTAYHLLWFDNPHGTNISGNALSLSLQLSFLENPRKKTGLNRFGINYW